MPQYRLAARQVSKTFGSTRVLSDAELLVEPGEIHALIGQNGSGKSTLVKILTGYHAPDAGMSLNIDDEAQQLPVRWDLISAAGVSVVHQDLGLRDDASVAENIGVGGFVHSRFLRRIDWKRQREITQVVLDRLDVDLDPATPVGVLNATQRAEVGIARALRDQTPGEGVIILDESTRALPREELGHFHALLKRVVAEGTSVIIVTHSLEEVVMLADRVTVLRDGRVVASHVATSEVSEQDMAKLMLGKAVGSVDKTRTDVEGEPVVAELLGVVAQPGQAPIDLAIRAGEVVGVTGMPGSPHESLPYIVGGARTAAAGSLKLNDTTIDLIKARTSRCLRAGVVLVPERRDRDGLAFDLSIRDNIALPNLRTRGRSWSIGRGWLRSVTEEAIRAFSIQARDGDTLVKELSGGNQQKVLFAKWLSVGPKVLVLHEPTQAVDVGARHDILTSIRTVASNGVGVLLASGEIADLVDVCDRILITDPSGGLHEVHAETQDDVVHAIYDTSTTTPVGA
jgi:ribose transport system ATP-binding protein